MSSQSQYLSILTSVASSNENFNISLETFNASSNVSISYAVTGLLTTDDEQQIAIKVLNQVSTYLIQLGLDYSGAPVFSDEEYQATFRVTRSEHCLCFWSQATFRLLIDNDTGAIININDNPIPITIADAQSISTVRGGSFEDQNGDPFTNEQIALLLSLASSNILARLNNKIVVSTYLNEFTGKDTKGVTLSPKPGISLDPLQVRRQSITGLISVPEFSGFMFNWIRSSGLLMYRFTQNFLSVVDPFGLNNEIRITFTAGYPDIPMEIKAAIVDFSLYSATFGSGAIESIAGGSFKLTLNQKTFLNELLIPIKGYKIK